MSGNGQGDQGGVMIPLILLILLISLEGPRLSDQSARPLLLSPASAHLHTEHFSHSAVTGYNRHVSRTAPRTTRMNPITAALRRPVTTMVLIAGVVFAGALAFTRMKVDIFPPLNLPVIYVCQPYGGMDPQQMEGLIAYYYEYHFLYIGGIHHVESKNTQGVSLMKLYFHPGTDMAQAMAETVGYVNRARAFMPQNTVGPFIM